MIKRRVITADQQPEPEKMEKVELLFHSVYKPSSWWISMLVCLLLSLLLSSQKISRSQIRQKRPPGSFVVDLQQKSPGFLPALSVVICYTDLYPLFHKKRSGDAFIYLLHYWPYLLQEYNYSYCWIHCKILLAQEEHKYCHILTQELMFSLALLGNHPYASNMKYGFSLLLPFHFSRLPIW